MFDKIFYTMKHNFIITFQIKHMFTNFVIWTIILVVYFPRRSTSQHRNPWIIIQVLMESRTLSVKSLPHASFQFAPCSHQHIITSNIRFLLHSHHCYTWINLWWQWYLDFVLVYINTELNKENLCYHFEVTWKSLWLSYKRSIQ